MKQSWLCWKQGKITVDDQISAVVPLSEGAVMV